MKRTIIFAVLCTAVIVTGCTKSNPAADGKALINKSISATDTATEKLSKASNGKEAADALTEYSLTMVKIAAEAKMLEARYSDIKLKNDDAFKEENARLEESLTKFMQSMFPVVAKFKDSPELQKAAEAMGNLKDQI